jgi:hypothetical protein
MKTILGPVLGAMLVAAAPASAAAQSVVPAQADQAAKLGEARAIIAVMFPPAERQAMMDKLVVDLTGQFRAMLPADAMADPGLKAIVDDFLEKALVRQRPVLQKHMPEQLEAMALAYAREFSLAELKDIHAFAGTSSGGHYLSKAISVVGDPAVAKANTATIAEIHAVTQEMLPELQGKLVAYLQAHPDVAARIAAKRK